LARPFGPRIISVYPSERLIKKAPMPTHAVASFPFPPRNPAHPNIHEILYVHGVPAYDPVYLGMYNRAQGDEARGWRFRYLGIEQELERAFQYVTPCDENAGAFSHKLADIIRSAANAYEIIAKELYAKLYNASDTLNIFNYLALDLYLQQAAQKIDQLAAIGDFPNHPEVGQPFVALAPWDRASRVLGAHVPAWWGAYNAIKHSNDGVRTHATLANAMAVTAALFLVIERVFGFGVLQGGMHNVYTGSTHSSSFRHHTQWARLFHWSRPKP
jgi:hypothetical protein